MIKIGQLATIVWLMFLAWPAWFQFVVSLVFMINFFKLVGWLSMKFDVWLSAPGQIEEIGEALDQEPGTGKSLVDACIPTYENFERIERELKLWWLPWRRWAALLDLRNLAFMGCSYYRVWRRFQEALRDGTYVRRDC